MADYRESSTDPAVKLSGVAALTTDQAMVVALSPNSALPAGSNVIGAQNVSVANVSASAALHTANVTVGLVVGANLTITGYGTTVIKVTGTFVASFAFKVSQDAGVSWDSVSATQVGGGDIFTVATLPGSYRSTVTGFDLLRVEVTLTSGSITITGKSTNAVNASKIVKLATSGLSIGTVQMAALTKGTQGATGVTNQAMKDSGRVNVAITCYQAPGIITTEALFAAATFSVSRDGGTPVTAQQLTVTTGKRFAIQSVVCGVKNTAAAAGTSKLVLRYSGAGGVISSASPVLAMLDLGSNSAVAAAYIGPTEMALPDSMELISASTFGFTNLSSAATMLHTITINGYEY